MRVSQTAGCKAFGFLPDFPSLLSSDLCACSFSRDFILLWGELVEGGLRVSGDIKVSLLLYKHMHVPISLPPYQPHNLTYAPPPLFWSKSLHSQYPRYRTLKAPEHITHSREA